MPTKVQIKSGGSFSTSYMQQMEHRELTNATKSKLTYEGKIGTNDSKLVLKGRFDSPVPPWGNKKPYSKNSDIYAIECYINNKLIARATRLYRVDLGDIWKAQNAKNTKGLDTFLRNHILGGSSYDNIIEGGNGNDFIISSRENVHVKGGNGNDFIISSKEYDVLTGGKGMDMFVAERGTTKLQPDLIKDFSKEDLLIVVHNKPKQIFYREVNNSTILSVGNGPRSIDLVEIRGYKWDNLTNQMDIVSSYSDISNYSSSFNIQDTFFV